MALKLTLAIGKRKSAGSTEMYSEINTPVNNKPPNANTTHQDTPACRLFNGTLITMAVNAGINQ